VTPLWHGRGTHRARSRHARGTDPLTMDSGLWMMDNGLLMMDHGPWTMDCGWWNMEHGTWNVEQLAHRAMAMHWASSSF